MASRIQGITIEIGGETTGLQKALADVSKQSIDIQKELKDVDRLLKFDPSNVEAAAQKQKLLSQQIEVTSNKLEQLKAAEQQVQAQFEKGDIGEKQYRAFKREIEFTEGSLDKLKQTLSKVDDAASLKNVKQDLEKIPEGADKAEGSIKDLGGELTNLVAGAAAVGSIGELIEKSLDTSSFNTKINLSFDVPEESKASIMNAISTIETYGVDGEAALEGVRKQWTLNKDASDESNAAVVTGAATIAATYSDIDFSELIQETNEVAKTLGITNEEALALTNSLLKTGFPPDQVDIIAEYGTQLKMAGYNAEEIQALFAAGVDTKTWNIDNLMDGLKEGRIKVAEFGQGVPKAMAALVEGTNISTTQLQIWGQAVAAGGEGGSKAMTEIASALNGVDDATQKNALGVALFGTMYEDQGQNIVDTLLNAKGATVDLKASQDELNNSTAQLNADPAIMMQQAMSNLSTALAPVMMAIAGIVAAIAAWMINNPTLTATIVAIVSAVTILIGICMGLAPIFTTITATAGMMGISLAAIAIPVTIAVAAIVALIAIGVALYQNWDWLSQQATQIWNSIKDYFSQIGASIKANITNTWNSIKVYFSQAWADIKTNITNTWDEIKVYFSQKWTEIKNNITNTWDAIKEYFSQAWINISNTIRAAWTNIATFFFTTWEGIKTNIVTILTAILQFIINTFQSILTTTTNIFSNVATVIVGVWNGISSSINTIVGAIVTTVQGKFEALKGAVSERMAGVKNTIIEIWNQAKDFLGNINLVEVGKNAIQGLINGIKSMAGEVSRAIRNIADKVTDGIKDALDIHSPSRVLKSLGAYTGQGYAIGIQSTIGEISKQSKAMAAAAIPDIPHDTLTAASGRSQSSGSSINQTVNIYSPSTLSTSETAKQNKRVLQELALAL